MLIRGRWIEVRDDHWLPTCEVIVRSTAEQHLKVDFLVDTGADQTLLSADVANALQTPLKPLTDRLFGVGSPIDVLSVETALFLVTHEGRELKFSGVYPCCTNPRALDMSVLGRDILDHFALIVDRTSDVILLLRDRHTYRVDPA